MAETTPTTRLEAVNKMLRSIGEAPVTQLVEGAGVDAPNALEALDQNLRLFLSEGWSFNTEDEYPLPRSTAGEVTVPRQTLAIAFPKASDIRPTVRGIRVYDRKNHTYSFSRSLTAKITFALPFEELPEPARAYVTIKAARQFQNDYIGEAALARFSERDEATARAVFLNSEADAEGWNMLNDTPDFYRVRS